MLYGLLDDGETEILLSVSDDIALLVDDTQAIQLSSDRSATEVSRYGMCILLQD